MNLDLPKLRENKKHKHGSQYGETGIINNIFEQLNIIPKYGVEFGAGSVSSERGTANIRWFNDKYNMECLYFETNKLKINQSDQKYRNQIKIEAITASNVNEIFSKYNVPKDLDIVVIDIDGQDYYVWEALEYNPKIMLIEFNPSLPYTESKVMHYDESHYKWRNTKCAYYGASITALKKLGLKKEYSLVYKTERNLIFIHKSLVDVNIDVKDLHPNISNESLDKNRKYILKKSKRKWVEI